MAKLRLLTIMLMTVGFLLSLWAVPAVMIVMATTCVHTLWIRIALICGALLWLFLLRPWSMFRDPRFGRFLSDMRRALNALIS